jgi:acid phosphatase type 7
MGRTALKLLSSLLGLCLLGALGGAGATSGDEPPRFELAAPAAGAPLVFVAYGDTRFSQRTDIVNARARRALVGRIADESPAAILIGGDLVFEGTNPQDYETYRSETTEWAKQKIPVFPALGNHEFRGCARGEETPCLENWWKAFSILSLRPHRWYSVSLGPTLLALMLDSDSALKPGSEQREWLERQITHADPRVKFILIALHYPPVRDPFYPVMKDEKEIERYLSKHAATLRAQVVVVGSHVHNYERYSRDGVTYLVSGGGGAEPVPASRMFGELSRLTTSVNFHYLRFTLDGDRLTGTMVRFDADDHSANPWSEPDRFEVRARSSLSPGRSSSPGAR